MAAANDTVDIRNANGTTIGTGVADGSGSFTIAIPQGQATANQSLHAVAKVGAVESTPTIFTTPADPVTVDAPTIESVTGTSFTGHTIKGTAPLGTQVQVRNSGGTVIGTTATDNEGNFEIALPIGLTTANQNLFAKAIDENNNQSPETSFTTPADPVAVTAPTVDSVTGNSTSGYTVTGTATAGNTVEIKNTGGTVIGSTITDGSGNYTVNLPIGSATPNQQLNAIAKDGDGNQSPATSFTTPADPVEITAPTVNTVIGSSTAGYTVTGTATAGNTVEIRNTGGTVIGSGIADPSGNFTITLPIGSATPNQQLNAVAKDGDGNQSPATPFTTPADPVTITSPTVDSITGNSTTGYTVTGTATAGNTVEIRNTGGTVIGSSIADGDGNYTVTIPAGSATPSQQLSAVAKDGDGNQSPATPFTTPADPVVIAAPTVESVTGNSTSGYTVTGTATAGHTVEIRNTGGTLLGTTTVDEGGSFIVTLPVGATTASQQLNVVAKDEDGNTSPGTTFVTPADPAVIVATPVISKVTGNSLTGYTIFGKATPGNTVKIYNADDFLLGQAVVGEAGTFTITLPIGFAQANEQLPAIALDPDENQSSPASFKLPIDPTTTTISAPIVENVTGSSTTGYNVSGTADPGTIVDIYNAAGNKVGSGNVDENGDFNANILPGMVKPNEVDTAVSRDNNGNHSESTSFVIPSDPGTGNNGNNSGTGTGTGTNTNGTGTTSGSQNLGGTKKNLPNNGEV